MAERKIDYFDPAWYGSGVNMVDCDSDWSWRFMTGDCSSKEGLLRGAERYFDNNAGPGTEITDMSFCVFCQTSWVDSAVMDWAYRTLTARVEKEGTIKDFERADDYPKLYRALGEYGVDWAAVCLGECKKRGIRPWIYFRMNDLHWKERPDSVFHDSFFFKARENGWLIGNKAYGWPAGTSGNIRNSYNFAVREVRERMLSYIEEMALRYGNDAFGFELDFMRNIYCFDYLNEKPGYQEYMTDFMRRAKAILKKAEEKHGHPLKLLARIAHTPEDNYLYGYDAAEWVKEGIVDVIVPSCEEVCNSQIDVAGWRKAIGDTPLFIGFDDHVTRWIGYNARNVYAAREKHLRGFAASYYDRGADGMYYENQYASTGNVRFIGKTTCSSGLRTFMVTEQDITPMNKPGYQPRNVVGDGWLLTNGETGQPLPLAVGGKGDSGTDFELDIGPIRPEEHAYLTVGYDREGDFGEEATLGGRKPDGAERLSVPDTDTARDATGYYYRKDWTLTCAPAVIRYRFDGLRADGALTVHFADPGKELNIVYMDLTVSPEEL